MKKAIFIITLFLFASTSLAGVGSHVVIAFQDSKSTSVSIIKQADYLSVPLTLSSKQKDPNIRFSEMSDAQNRILREIDKRQDIIIKKGPISLSPRPTSKFASYSYGRPSEAQFNILVGLKDCDDAYSCAGRIRKIIDTIEMPGKSHASLGQVQLAVENPEKYRKDILKKIAQDIEFLKAIMGTKDKASVTGLERPVLVRQVDDKYVELFINYNLTIGLSNKGIE
ncbi:MAG: hypothetical protein PVH87_02610 [Desulfobacteraceae bacterium]|jgi:hypothetical protein